MDVTGERRSLLEACSFSTEYVVSKTEHYRICLCGNKSDRATHTFVEGKCSVCEYPDPNYVSPTGQAGTSAGTGGSAGGGSAPQTYILEENVPLAELGAAISVTVEDTSLNSDFKRNLDGSITVAVTDANGNAAKSPVRVAAHGITDGQVVALLDDTGAVQKYIKKSVVDDGVAYALIDGSATIRIEDNATAFSDVKSGDWYKGAADFASSHGLFNGVTATTFAPNTNMNRAMLVTVLHRLEETPTATAAASFSDVRSDYYTEAVKWASANQIVGGYEDGTFRPMNNITRQEMAVILCRYMAKQGFDVSARADFSAYSDGAKVASWASDAMAWAVQAGIITGNPDGTLNPTGTATRAQVATMLMRVVKTMVK